MADFTSISPNIARRAHTRQFRPMAGAEAAPPPTGPTPPVFAPGTAAFAVASNPLAGGERVRVTGTGLDFLMTAGSDDFADGVLGALWTDASTGSGALSENADDGVLLFQPNGGAAVLEGVDGLDAFDGRVTGRRAPGSTVVFELEHLPGTRVRLTLDDTGVTFTSEVDGTTLYTERVANATTRVDVGLLRTPQFVWPRVSGTLGTRAPWTPEAALVRVSVSGGDARLSGFARYPVVTFDGEPAADIQRWTDSLVEAIPPPAPSARPDAVDVRIVTVAAESLLPGGFAYQLADPQDLDVRDSTVSRLVWVRSPR